VGGVMGSSSFAIIRHQDIYHWRSKIYEVCLEACGDTSAGVKIAAGFSDVAKYLIDHTQNIHCEISINFQGGAVAVGIVFKMSQVNATFSHSFFEKVGFFVDAKNNQTTASQQYQLTPRSDNKIDVGALIGILEIKSRDELFQELNLRNEQLHVEVEERKKAELTLQENQRDFIENEKLAALGSLVAGIAHEINTPVGIGVTATSHLRETLQRFTNLYQEGKMKRSDLDELLVSVKDLNEMVEVNLQRASNLIRSFKEVAVDQTAEDEREFSLAEYSRQVITSLTPKMRTRRIEINIDGIDPNITLKTTPGPISQILVNLISNSLVHGFNESEAGTISISAKVNQRNLDLIYRDTGRGISPENLDKIFDPFFTTKRSHGGSGLGMHLVFNIVTKKFHGKIRCESALGHGVLFTITLNDVVGFSAD
jgi:signal transduction histidine kinase